MSENEPVVKQKSDQTVINNSSLVDPQQFTIALQKYYSQHKNNSKKLEWTNDKVRNVIKLIDEYNLAKVQGKRPSNKQYHHAKKYDTMIVDNKKILIMKRKSDLNPAVQIIPTSEYYQLILDAHIATDHGRRDKIVHALRNKYMVPIFAIIIFLQLCKTCLSKRNVPKSGLIVKQLTSNFFNRRGQIDFVDFQSTPDGEYKWLLQYQDDMTRFCFLRPLRSIEAKEVTTEILKIFLEVGCPNILQSNNGGEFTALVLKEIMNLWPVCKIVNGGPRHPQSQESIKHLNQDVKSMVLAWMVDNNSTNWALGCYFVQFQKNSSFDSTIAKSPFKALFGDEPKCGLSSTDLSKNIISELKTEEDVKKLYEEVNKNNQTPTINNEYIIPDQVVISNYSNEIHIENEESNIQNSHMSHTNKQYEAHIVNKINHLEQDVISNNTDVLPDTCKSPLLSETLIIKSEIKTEDEQDLVDDDEITIPDKTNISNDTDSLVLNENPLKIEKVDILICHICNKEAFVEHACLKCNRNTHTACGVLNEDYGSKLICNLCMKEINTMREQTELHMNLKRTTDEMTDLSSKKLKYNDMDAIVLVEDPKVDVPNCKKPLNTNNVIGRVIETNNTLHRVDTSFGIINDLLPGSAMLSMPVMILSNNIPDGKLPLKPIAANSSFSGQGVKQCSCRKSIKGICLSNKCNCKKADILCNSRCHKSLTCNNI